MVTLAIFFENQYDDTMKCSMKCNEIAVKINNFISFLWKLRKCQFILIRIQYRFYFKYFSFSSYFVTSSIYSYPATDRAMKAQKPPATSNRSVCSTSRFEGNRRAHLIVFVVNLFIFLFQYEFKNIFLVCVICFYYNGTKFLWLFIGFPDLINSC